MEYHLEKPNWQRKDLNLRRRCQSTSLLTTRPFCSPKKEASSPCREEQLLSLPFVHVIPHIMTNANFMI